MARKESPPEEPACRGFYVCHSLPLVRSERQIVKKSIYVAIGIN